MADPEHDDRDEQDDQDKPAEQESITDYVTFGPAQEWVDALREETRRRHERRRR